jgi:hypothetical protein
MSKQSSKAPAAPLSQVMEEEAARMEARLRVIQAEMAKQRAEADA